MTPAARLQAVLELTATIAHESGPADVIIDGYFRKRRYAGSSDRRAVNERVYKILRHRARLDWWIERTGLKITDVFRARLIAHLTLADKLAVDEIATLFSGTNHTPEPLGDMETRLQENLYGRPVNHAEMPRHVRFEYPAWMDKSLAAVWGDSIETELSALNQKAPVDVRVNTVKTTLEQVQKAFSKDYIEAGPTALSPLGLRLPGNPKLGGTEAFKKGWIEVQDEGSQLVSLLCGAAPGMHVADFCAGAGGKTLALAAMMTEKGKIRGRLDACDVSRFRLDRMKPRLKRAGIKGVRLNSISAKDCSWTASRLGQYDRVLVDAPCTGTGAWRRDPTARWRFSPNDLADIIKTQQRILHNAAGLVKPGGRLIYVTCSLLIEENEHQTARFLEDHKDFKTIAMDQVWRETIGEPPPPPAPWLRLSPASTGTDGFFAAVFERA